MASGDPRASSGVYPGVRDCPCPFCPKKGAPRWQRWGFSRKTLLRSGEEAAVCTGPSELSWALVAWLPIWNETAPLAAQPGACGESDSLRRGPLGLMFNWFPPHQGTLAPAALGLLRGGPQIQHMQPPACGGRDLGEEGSQAGTGRVGAGGILLWSSLPRSTRPTAHCRGGLTSCCGHFATDTPQVAPAQARLWTALPCGCCLHLIGIFPL